MRVSSKVFILVTGLGLGQVLKAEPAWSLEASLGAGLFLSRHEPDSWSGNHKSSFPSLTFSAAAEKWMRGPYAVGARFSQGFDPSMGMGSPLSRIFMAALPYVKQTLAKAGPADFTALAGLGFELLMIQYSDMGEFPDPALPPDEFYFSPVAAIGLSQRIFVQVIGLTVTESFRLSAHAASFHLDFGIPFGWRRH